MLKTMVMAGCLWLVVIGWGFVGSGQAPAAHKRLDVTDLARGTVRLVGYRGEPVIVLHRTRATIDGLGEASSKEVHPAWFVARAQAPSSGCRITWLRATRRFRASCSNAMWDAAGQPAGDTTAPPLRIPPYRLTDDGHLVLGAGA